MSSKSNFSKRYTAEFRRDAVELALASDKTVTEVARGLGVSPESLRGWVKQAKADRGQGPEGALTSDEKEELRRLRRENREQQQTIWRALQAQGADEWLVTYNARAGIEGTISQAVRGPGLRHSRYRGLPKVHLQNVLTGMALNLTRLGAYFNPSTNPTTRPSKVRELCTAHGLAAA